jgi:hypothetical protein
MERGRQSNETSVDVHMNPHRSRRDTGRDATGRSNFIYEMIYVIRNKAERRQTAMDFRMSNNILVFCGRFQRD